MYFPSGLVKWAFFVPLGKSGESSRVLHQCDWIGFYKMNCQEKSSSQLHCQEVSVLLQPLWSALSYQDLPVWEDVYMQQGIICNRKTRFCGLVQYFMKLQMSDEKRVSEVVAVFCISCTHFNLAEYNTDGTDCANHFFFYWQIFLHDVTCMTCWYGNLPSVFHQDNTYRRQWQQGNNEVIFTLTFPTFGLHRYLKLKTQRAKTRKTRTRTSAIRW